MTDNKNRLASEIRIATNKRGGTIANPGSVAFNFSRKGILQVLKKQALEEELFLLVSDAGAEDFEVLEDFYIITTKPEDLYKIKDKITEKGIIVEDSSIEMIAKNDAKCSKEDFDKNVRLIEFLENIEDVDSIFHNMLEE